MGHFQFATVLATFYVGINAGKLCFIQNVGHANDVD